ncbi:carbohydrate ABC transporter permease [Arthrobacter sp. ov118]|uniref:carbohydrate ABC transporter permease n=1 Tax=Arthrobacter sp. ov118 TaxID=1761747 RepID=UPI0008F3784F|nr:sugar ABC transporter permease [Arthrobacter sp. ov118]SFT54811.1 raffinose/stachyose/melibiose transport system permease protein [Arthrobacter sp. ov118]
MTISNTARRPAVPHSVPKSAGRPAQEPTKKASSRRWRNLVWVLPAASLLCIFAYLPLMQNLGFSMLKWDIYSGRQTFVGADNYIKMFNDPIFWRSLLNNTLYAGISIVFQVFGALILAAMVEGLRSERWRGILRAIYFVPSAISLTVAGLLFYFIYEPRMGILNAALEFVGLGNITQAWLGQENTAIFGIVAMSQWQGFGYCTLLFAVALQRIPSELYEAASIDGVGPFRRFFSISLPLVREMSSLMMIVTVSGAFQVFNEVMVMTTGGPNNSSQVLGTWLYRSGFVRNDFGYAAAIATAVFIITLVLAVLQLRLSKHRRVQW